MTHAEALKLICPVVIGQTWADLGAGSGTFTRALAELIGEGGTVYAVDRDVRGLRKSFVGAKVEVIEADFTGLKLPLLDGLLLANALHFVRDQRALLQRLRGCLRPGGRIALLEYEHRPANPWVPYPIGFDRLAELLQTAGFVKAQKVSERPSRFGGTMYLATALAGP
jgi:ubiquinone/menaquinone biosynthesis C-methylase UbiE